MERFQLGFGAASVRGHADFPQHVIAPVRQLKRLARAHRWVLSAAILVLGALPIARSEAKPTPGQGTSSSSARIEARTKHGRIELVHHSLSKGILTAPFEGIVVVAGGAVHADANADGRLDAGEAIAYHYTVFNAGDLNLSALALADGSGTVTCPQTTLVPDAHMICTRTYVLTATDQTNGSVINSVTVTGQSSAGRPVQASDGLLTQNLAGGAGIRVFKSPRLLTDTDASQTVTEGDVVRYTFVIKNSNADALTAITLSEPDPSRIDNALACDALSLAGAAFGANGSGALGSTDTVLCRAEYVVRAADVASGEVQNLAEVSATAPGPRQVIATGTSLVVVPLSQISLGKTLTGGGPIADPGELLTYTLTFSASPASGRTFAPGSVTETVPANTVHVVGDGFTCVAGTAGSSCTNTLAVTVPSGSSATLTFTVRVLDPVAPGVTTIVNVVIPPTGAGCDPTAGCDESTPVRNQADLAVLKTGPAQIDRGQQVTWTIRVENRGPDAAINARLLDPTPAGLVFVSTAGACSGPFPCALGDMARNEVRTLTATYLVPADYSGSNMIINTVTAVSDSADPTPGDSSSSSSVVVSGGVPTFTAPAIIPVDARWAMLMLAGLVMLIASRRIER